MDGSEPGVALPSECRPRPADCGHEAQRSESERATEGNPEQAPRPGTVLGEREDETSDDHGDGDEDVGDRAAQTAQNRVKGTIPGHRRPCSSGLREGPDALQKEKSPADRKNHETPMIMHAQPPSMRDRPAPERNCRARGRTNSPAQALAGGAPRVCER